ncbi:MAG: hypothetical protein ACM3JC_08205 [Rudaea sp.]
MPDRVSLAGIAGGALLIVGAIALGIAAGFAVLHVGRGGAAAPRWAAHHGTPPPIAGAVQLQPAPAEDIAALREEKRRMISAYAWVDRAKGIARIPIDRAIVLLARQGGSEKP